MFEGEPITHAFLLRNKGAAPLDIIEVETDCGCTTVSYPDQIPPGGEGLVEIRIDSKRMGNTRVTKTTTVRSNDRKRPAIKLSLSGHILPVAELSASVIRLTGTAGQDIEQRITITPVAGNRFRILEVTLERGEHLEFRLTEIPHAGTLRYELNAYNRKQEKGWYTDKFHIRTDSEISPGIEIPVFGFIREP